MSAYIRRNDAISAISHLMQHFDSNDIDRDEALEALRKIPSADVMENVHGKFVRHNLKNSAPWGFDCTNCSEWFVIGEAVAKRYNYCPNCGADMRGEKDG